MPNLRQEFYGTLRQMLSLADLDLLTDRFPANDPHNLSARILRLGLAVSAFASLEKYLEARVDAVMKKLSGSMLASSPPGADLRKFVSIDAVLGLANRLNFQGQTARQGFVDLHLPTLAKYGDSPATFTALGFSPRGSNVSEADIHQVLSAFCIKKPWDRLAKVAADIGSSRIALKDNFISLSRTRNKSAHDPSSNVPTSDLINHIETSILIAVCFDCLAHTIVSSISKSTSFTNFELELASFSLNFRFVDKEIAGTWIERASDGKRVRKRYPDELAATLGASSRSGDAMIIVRDAQLVPLAVV